VWARLVDQEDSYPYIQAVDGGTVLELFKYVTKVSDLLDNPEAVRIFLRATYGKRFVRTYGSLYRLKPNEDAEDLRGCCPDCGSDVVTDVGVIPHQAVYFDNTGVLRFCLSEAPGSVGLRGPP